jgi:hypothetical protein
VSGREGDGGAWAIRFGAILCAGVLALGCGRSSSGGTEASRIEAQQAADASTIEADQDASTADAGVTNDGPQANGAVAGQPPLAGGPPREATSPPPSSTASSEPPPTAPPGSGPATACSMSSASSDCPDPGECWRAACVGGACAAVPESAGTTCSSGRCNGLGVCAACATNADCQSTDLCVIGRCVQGACELRPSPDCADCPAGSFRTQHGESCKPWRSCQVDEFQVRPPSLTSDRVCAKATVCAPGHFTARELTPTQDRSCLPCPPGTFASNPGAGGCLAPTTCGFGEYIAAEATATSDRLCSECAPGTFAGAFNSPSCLPFRECGPAEYESFSGWSQANRQCAPLSSCQPGSFVRTAPTRTQDRHCERCPYGSYSSDVNSRSCTSWQASCGREQYEIVAPSSLQDRQCATMTTCPPGTFVSGTNWQGDRYCSSCGEGEYSTVSNARSCTPRLVCRANEFQVGGSQTEASQCQPVTDCIPGQFVRQLPSPTRDRSCAACFAGTFSSAVNAIQCRDWSICGIGEIVGQQPSPTQNRVCMQPGQCAPGSFRAAVRDVDAGASECTPCAPGTFSATVDATSCQPWTECGAAEVEVIAPSVTSDRHCDARVEAPRGVFASIAMAPNYACAIKAFGEVLCFGPAKPSVSPATSGPASLVLGRNHACSIGPRGRVTCWGGDDAARVTPPSDVAFSQIAVNDRAACGIRTVDQTAECWGSIVAPPIDPLRSITGAADYFCGIRARDGEALCWGNEKASAVATWSLDLSVLVAGDSELCALTSYGFSLCHTVDPEAPFHSSPSERYSSIAVGSAHGCALDQRGRLECWGDNSHGQATPPPRDFTAVFAAGNATCGLLRSGQPECWGSWSR